jgi:hypothetical protein
MFTTDTMDAVDHSARKFRRAHAERLLRAVSAFDRACAGDAWSEPLGAHEYALLNHVFFGLQAAARAGDTELAGRFAALWRERRIGGDPAIAPVVVPASSCRQIADDRYLSPVYLVDDPHTVRAPLPPGWQRLCELTADTAWIVRQGAGIVVVTEEIGETDDTNSWAITGVSATVYTKAPAGDVRPAEAVVHESAHNLLNAVLSAREVTFADQPLWYSPWKATDRPAFGIVHAVFAFSVLVTYWASVLEDGDVNDRMKAYCRMRIADEVSVLETMGGTLTECLAQVDDGIVRNLVQEAAAAALRVRVPVR